MIMKINKIKNMTKIIALAWVFVIISILIWPELGLHLKLFNSGVATVVAVIVQITADLFYKE